ncbi:hypothetical protein [Pseudomonas aeruginosa]|uniref:hypothetical protein n=1 Tax=Pseudomonas aeruginosa TaxID=287 RepID=UPI000EAD9C4C|nr:hypothetical protein [Pseudomonas aeruginosa]EKV4551475.1 hypothetical protein [Pseudomonas aeruginosa]MBG4902751.1 hypothetical protein [Pseudomonas aeruginosa]MBG6316884.1 hypothetical protein [Pseudomonas aeruginosa]MBI8571402.1 hypothetical protein [Pseudomonas aeruginosa]MBI8655539.1 hypothetical protein [Pseudomonas aeruginosa]
MADEYIYDVKHVARDNDRSLIVRCPHCQEICGIEGDDLDDVVGGQYQCRCSGWFQIDFDARMAKNPLPANKGIPG